VAARLRLAAVAVPEAQARRNACIRRGLDGDELVGTDADLRVAYPGDLVSRWLERLGARVHDNEVIAQPVHLEERPAARLGPCRGFAGRLANRHAGRPVQP